MKKFVYMFSEGNAKMRNTLGGKGANLAEMTIMGIPVPQGFIVSTDACLDYLNNNKTMNKTIEQQIVESLKNLENITNKKFGDENNPLLISIRSGARVSMPGMMDSILNLGLNDVITRGLAKQTKNEWFAYDCYRRFIQMYSNVVEGIDSAKFEEVISRVKTNKNIVKDTELSVEDLLVLINEFKNIYKQNLNKEFPQDVRFQLFECIKAVFRSWNNPRAITYRKLNNIPDDWGTAVNVQQMVFGNKGDNCATGVAFSRNPVTGENKIYGEYLFNAQGEDIVSGVRTPYLLEHLKQDMPSIYNQFLQIAKKLEIHFKDMQDIEFTVEDNTLYILQTRNAKRTAEAMVKVATDFVKEDILTKQEALLSINPEQIETLLHAQFDKDEQKKAIVLGHGLPASPGCGYGKVVFNAESAVELSKKEKVILVRQETSTEDIDAMHISNGVITARGGMTSHAAVIARGMGTPCVAGTENLTVNEESKSFALNGKTFNEGDYISIDGSNGNIYLGQIKTTNAKLSEELKTILKWSKEFSKLKVKANADNAIDAKQALDFGADGIGLCRTEHMFFKPERIIAIRQMILANTVEERTIALEKLLPMQKQDFIDMFKVVKNKPFTIRYLDPPLHEFLPKEESEIEALSKALNVSVKSIKDKIESLKEVNPMMGHRGCRLDITYPEIAIMQTKAIIEAGIYVKQNYNIDVNPEIMVPLTCDLKEFEFVKNIIDDQAKKIFDQQKCVIKYKVGTMIEVPRSAVLAGQIAKQAEFFSFGTNDLTQLTYGFSRDDAGKFLDEYYNKKIFSFNPFAQIDESGVGRLLEMAVKLGKNTRPNLELGICGEHGGNSQSIAFCNKIGLDYVSCSPYRVPVAIISACQATLKNN